MPPGPLEPASIPTTKNNNNVGMPKRAEVFVVNTLIINSNEPINNIFSLDSIIQYRYRFKNSLQTTPKKSIIHCDFSLVHDVDATHNSKIQK